MSVMRVSLAVLCAIFAAVSCVKPAAEAEPPASPPPQIPAPVSPEVQQLIDRWRTLNSRCRGGSGDDDATWRACDARDAKDGPAAKLNEAGWCRGRKDEAGYQMEWHVCGPTSLR